jgi:hypothetical protein
VWHRTPDGEWTFYATTPGPQSCSRYFSSATAVDPVVCGIESRWVTPWSLVISVDGILDWQVDIKAPTATRVMTAIGTRLPAAAWTSRTVPGLMNRVVGPVLGIGKVRLAGIAPNGQQFRIGPKRVWAVAGSTAVVRGEDLGPVGRARQSRRLPASSAGHLCGRARPFRPVRRPPAPRCRAS